MDDRIVDALARRAAEAVDRRGLLALIAGAALTFVVSPLDAVARKKKKKKGKKKGRCKGNKRLFAQGARCDPEQDLCESDAERNQGKQQAATCRETYRGYCSLLVAFEDDCNAELPKCCAGYERCNQGDVASCRDDAFRAFPELCDFVFIPGVCT